MSSLAPPPLPLLLQYYDMLAYSARMDVLRNGGTLASSSYDPNADMMAHSSSLKRPVKETETYLSKAQLEDLRRVQNERTEFAKRKVRSSHLLSSAFA
jgi:hypothetical protein